MFSTKQIDGYNHVRTPMGADYITCPFCSDYIQTGTLNIFDHSYYCTGCEIFFGICCKYAIHGCTDDEYYPSFLNLEINDVIMLNPVIPANQWNHIKKLKKNKNIKYKFICQCPGYCTHGSVNYSEYNGLGLYCCKLSKDEKKNAEIILKERQHEKEKQQVIDRLIEVKKNYIEQINNKYYTTNMLTTIDNYARSHIIYNEKTYKVTCPNCFIECKEDAGLSEWILQNSKLPFFYCEPCYLIFSFIKCQYKNCPILVSGFSYKNVKVDRMPLFSSKEELMFRIPLIKLYWKEICIDCPKKVPFEFS